MGGPVNYVSSTTGNPTVTIGGYTYGLGGKTWLFNGVSDGAGTSTWSCGGVASNESGGPLQYFWLALPLPNDLPDLNAAGPWGQGYWLVYASQQWPNNTGAWQGGSYFYQAESNGYSLAGSPPLIAANPTPAGSGSIPSLAVGTLTFTSTPAVAGMQLAGPQPNLAASGLATSAQVAAIATNPLAVIAALITAGVLQYVAGSSEPLQFTTTAIAELPPPVNVSTEDTIEYDGNHNHRY